MLQQRLDELLGAAARDGTFSGVVVAARGEDEVFAGAYGLACRPWRVANQVDTRFRIASVGKMFTAIAVAQLLERGRLELDTRVVELLGLHGTQIPPEVTVRHLLTMTAGIADWFEESGDAAAAWEALCRSFPIYLLRDNRDYLPLFAQKLPDAPVGERHAYSNASYILLGLAVERASGEPYFDYVRRHVFAPAGMAQSDFVALDDVADGVAEGYVPVGEGWKRNIYAATPAAAADGGATATAGDLLRFLRALRGGALVSPAMASELLTPKVADGDQPYRGYHWWYGYGCMFLTDEQGAIVRYGHTGEEEGVSCRLWGFPQQGLDVAILGNLSGCAGKIGWAIHDLVVG